MLVTFLEIRYLFCFISHAYLVEFLPGKSLIVLCCWLSDDCSLFLVLMIKFSNAKYIHCTLLVISQSRKIELLPFCKHFGILKHQWRFVCCLLVPKYVHSTICEHFNSEKHQPCLSCLNLNSKYKKPTLLLCFQSLNT